MQSNIRKLFCFFHRPKINEKVLKCIERKIGLLFEHINYLLAKKKTLKEKSPIVKVKLSLIKEQYQCRRLFKHKCPSFHDIILPMTIQI